MLGDCSGRFGASLLRLRRHRPVAAARLGPSVRCLENTRLLPSHRPTETPACLCASQGFLWRREQEFIERDAAASDDEALGGGVLTPERLHSGKLPDASGLHFKSPKPGAGTDHEVDLGLALPPGMNHVVERRQVVEQVASQVFIPLTVGGGVKEVADVRRLLNAGADKVAINTAAVFNPEFVKEASDKFGAQCIVVAIDAKQIETDNGEAKWEIFTHGGRKPTGIDAIEWAKKMESYGAGEILLTSMDRDGTKIGFDLALTRAVSEAVNVPVIASGGVGNLEHLADGIIEGKAEAVLAASIFHFAEYTVNQAKVHMRSKGIDVRL